MQSFVTQNASNLSLITCYTIEKLAPIYLSSRSKYHFTKDPKGEHYYILLRFSLLGRDEWTVNVMEMMIDFFRFLATLIS
jgi:hypothetical protein